ncbi:MAG: hypothetical protein F4Z17_12895 [Acidimicrobiia bacterium]|nr:hypothetical protein [Acidimicrobiia bacterium]
MRRHPVKDTSGFAVGEASDPASVRMPGVQGGNSPATGAPAITGAVHVGAILTADTSGIADTDGLVETTFRYQWLADDANISGATSTTYLVTDADLGKFIKVKVSFSDDGDNDETLTSEATVAVEPDLPVTASIHDAPQSHDGESTFTFELRFSEEFKISYRTLRDHAFTVTGGRVESARRLERNSDEPNLRWEIRIAPGSGGDVTIVLPITTDCEDNGAICTAGARMLSTSLELTVTGPGG